MDIEYLNLGIVKLQAKMGTDKLLCLMACFFITVLVTVIFKNFMSPGDALPLGFIAALFAGLGREAFNKYVKKGSFDSINLCFYVIGIAMAAFTILCFI